MEKRTKLGLLVVAVLILFAIGLYFLLSPVIQNFQVQQPAPLPEATTPQLPKTRPRPKPGEVPSSTIPQLEISDQSKLRMLETKSMTMTERIYSGSNSDGFTGYDDVAADFSSKGQTWLKAEQARMQTAHPVKGSAYGVTAHAVSSKLDTAAKWGDATIAVTVQVVLREEAIGSTPTQNAKRVVYTFEHQTDGTYLVSNVAVSEIAL